MSDLHAREIAIRRRLRDDLVEYAAKALKIKTKDGGIYPFRLNKAQLHLHAEIEQQRAETGKVRAIGLKGRQQGFSTYCEARFYWRVTHQRGASAYILTHEQAATDNLFAMAARFHEHCHPLLKPQTGTANAKELHFDKLDSGYRVGTAGSKAVGRSSTIQLFHGSELAFWPNAAEHFAGVLQAVPSARGTEIILESTANGVGGTFHDLWTAATRGETEYKAIFVPWFWQPEYRREDPGFVATDVEKDLAKTYGLDLLQLAWRRNKIAELRSSDLFKQEFPCVVGRTKVSTQRGIIPIDSIIKGDVCATGTIEDQWMSGVKPVFRITTSLGYALEATAEHPLALADGGFVNAGVSDGCEIRLVPPRFADDQCAVEWSPYPSLTCRAPVTEEFSTFLGLFMANGSYSNDTLSIACNRTDDDLARHIEGLLIRLFGRATSRVVGTKKGGIEVRLGAKGIRELLVNIGAVLVGTENSQTKRHVCVPDVIWRSPKPVVAAFIRGLFEGDGFSGYQVPRVSVHSRYREFLQDVQLLLLGFGITCRLHSANKKSSDGDYAYIGNELTLRATEARSFISEIGFLSSRKQDRGLDWLQEPTIGRPPLPMTLTDTVATIELVGIEPVYDLTVTGTHVFDANGILVHNCSPEEAFLYSGRPVFERDWLLRAKRETCNPIARRRLIGEKWTDAESGELRVWAEPKPDTRYVIGADVAEGLEHGDYSCADVLECPSGTQVAQWHGHLAPDLFGDLLAKLGRHYNTAFVGVERNNHGLTTLTKLRDGGYPQLYAQADLEYRGSADKETKRLGWLTTQKSKFKVIDTLAGELRDGDHGLLCKESLDELYSFVIHEDGSYGAQVGQYDDRVMSRAIAGEMLYAQGYGRHRERHPKEDKAA